jgi:sensor histidine kinase regulating citrate/malate metabolism
MSRDTWLLLGAVLVGAVLTSVLQTVVPDASWWKLVLAALLLLLLGLRRWRARQA